MKNTPCIYAPIRFRPYHETGEFANVGVILCAPDRGYMAYALSHSLDKHTADFFPNLDRAIYVAATEGLRHLLDTFCGKNLRGDDALMRFHRFVTPKEGLITCGKACTQLTDNPDQALTDIYRHLVQRQFTQKKTHQHAMLDRLTACLKEWNIDTLYQQRTIGAHGYKVQFKFVNDEIKRQRVILPLDFAGHTTTEIYNIADQWTCKIDRLNKFGLHPEMIIVVHKKDTINATTADAIRSVYDELRKGHHLVDIDDQADELRTLAAASA